MEAVAKVAVDENQSGDPAGKGFKGGGPLFRLASIIGVSAYLFSVLIYLIASKKITPPCSFKKILRAQFRRRFRATLFGFGPDIGVAYVLGMPGHLISDSDGASSITLYENGVPLPHPHCAHDEIRRIGQGRYSHWGPHLFFSTSDNTDPRTNGRVYTVAEG